MQDLRETTAAGEVPLSELSRMEWGLPGGWRLDTVNKRIIPEGKWAETPNFVYLCIHL